jgi:hypothetical protein
VRQRDDDDVVADDLVWQREWKAVEHRNAPITPVFSLRSRLGKP